MKDCKLSVVRVFVHDFERALDFYTNALGLEALFQSAEMGWAQLDTGECNLAIEQLARDDEEAEELVGRFVGVSIRVPDIHAVYEDLVARGVEFNSQPTKQPWGGTITSFRDPEDNVLTLLGTDV